MSVCLPGRPPSSSFLLSVLSGATVSQCHSLRINIYLVFLPPAQAIPHQHQIIDEPVRQCGDKPPSLSEMGLRGLRLKVRETDIIISIFLSTSTDYSDFVSPLRENYSARES